MDRATIFASSNSGHLAQLYTGFELLASGKIVDVERRFAPKFKLLPEKPEHLVDARYAHLEVLLNGDLRLYYDMHDSWEIDEEMYARCDVYFKRSYARARHTGMVKVRPFGLNYIVHPDGSDPFMLARALWFDTLEKKIKMSIRAATLADRFVFTPRVGAMRAPPEVPAGAPKVIFFARVWDPRDDPRRSRSKIDERESINEMRAGLVRRLRKELGPAFSGGLDASPFALGRYPDAVADRGATSQRAYVKTLREHHIGIATAGLHGSNGFKLAEYVAFSKAIVSESLRYEVPGGFDEGRNYLGFENGDGCVAAVVRLREDRDLLARMMRNNQDYYENRLRPDKLVLSTLSAANSSRA